METDSTAVNPKGAQKRAGHHKATGFTSGEQPVANFARCKKRRLSSTQAHSLLHKLRPEASCPHSEQTNASMAEKPGKVLSRFRFTLKAWRQ